jgi:hypothetical protein
LPQRAAHCNTKRGDEKDLTGRARRSARGGRRTEDTEKASGEPELHASYEGRTFLYT